MYWNIKLHLHLKKITSLAVLIFLSYQIPHYTCCTHMPLKLWCSLLKWVTSQIWWQYLSLTLSFSKLQNDTILFIEIDQLNQVLWMKYCWKILLFLLFFLFLGKKIIAIVCWSLVRIQCKYNLSAHNKGRSYWADSSVMCYNSGQK